MTTNERHETGTDEPTARVTSLLAAAAAPTEPGPQPGESLALAAFRVAHPHERTRMLCSINPVRAALTTSAAALLLTGSFAAAAAGALPGAAQDTAHEMLARIGVTVPGPNEASDGHPDGRGSSDDADETTSTEDTTSTDESTDDTTTADEESQGKGAEVSELAKNPDLSGIDKGAAVSTLASDGKSQAGQHGAATEDHGGAPADAGRPDGAGKPDTAGRPDTAGKPDDAGKPDTAGKPGGAGTPAAPGSRPTD